MRLSRPDPAVVRTAPHWPASLGSPEAQLALLASTAVGVTIVAVHVRFLLADAGASLTVRGLGAVPLVAAGLLFANVQLRLLRAENDPYQPWAVLGLGLVAAVPSGQHWALAPGAAAVVLRLDRRHLLAALAGIALASLAADRVGGTGSTTTAELVVQTGVPALLLAALTRLALSLDRPWRLHEQLLRHQVDLERDRVARDAHDLMGRTLVTAAIRTESALRAVGEGDPALRARLIRLRETLTAGERRVRTLASQPVISTWDDERELAMALCARLGIELVVDETGRLPSRYRALAGLVLRECVTMAIALRPAVRVHARLDVAPDDATVVRVVVDRVPGRAPDTPARVLDAVARVDGSVGVSDTDGTWALEARLPAAHPVRFAR